MSDVDLDAVEARYNAIAAYAVPEAMQAGPLPDDVIWRTAELLRDAAADVPVLAAELRQSRAGLAEARRLMAVDFDRARKAEDALAVEAERLRAALALQAEYDTAQREVERLRSLPAIDPDAYHEARAAIARVEALHQRYRPPHRDDVDICPECSQFPVDVPYPCRTVAALRGPETSGAVSTEPTGSGSGTAPEPCHCGEPVVYGYDGDPTHQRGMCRRCDLVRCDAYPGACDVERGDGS